MTGAEKAEMANEVMSRVRSLIRRKVSFIFLFSNFFFVLVELNKIIFYYIEREKICRKTLMCVANSIVVNMRLIR